MRHSPFPILLAALCLIAPAAAQGGPVIGGPGNPVPAAPPAPPAASSMEALDAAARAYVTGKWRAVVQQTVAGRVYETETIANYFAEGAYSGVVNTSMPGSGLSPVSLAIRGAWSVKAMDEANFVLVLKPENEAQQSLSLKIIDSDTLETPDGNRATRVR
jgi:hypothetical protein